MAMAAFDGFQGPYIATGKYINKMSNYSRRLPEGSGRADGRKDACPF